MYRRPAGSFIARAVVGGVVGGCVPPIGRRRRASSSAATSTPAATSTSTATATPTAPRLSAAAFSARSGSLPAFRNFDETPELLLAHRRRLVRHAQARLHLRRQTRVGRGDGTQRTHDSILRRLRRPRLSPRLPQRLLQTLSHLNLTLQRVACVPELSGEPRVPWHQRLEPRGGVHGEPVVTVHRVRFVQDGGAE